MRYFDDGDLAAAKRGFDNGHLAAAKLGGCTSGMVGKEQQPGARVTVPGDYEELNVLGRPTGRVIIAAEDEELPASPRGFTWRPLSEHSIDGLRARASKFRRMAATARTQSVLESLQKVAERLEGLADRREQEQQESPRQELAQQELPQPERSYKANLGQAARTWDRQREPADGGRLRRRALRRQRHQQGPECNESRRNRRRDKHLSHDPASCMTVAGRY
jgi:hypothetical protein